MNVNLNYWKRKADADKEYAKSTFYVAKSQEHWASFLKDCTDFAHEECNEALKAGEKDETLIDITLWNRRTLEVMAKEAIFQFKVDRNIYREASASAKETIQKYNDTSSSLKRSKSKV